MSWVRVAAARLRGLFERKRLERELEDEVRFHLQMQMEDNLKAGMSPAEALSNRASSLARRPSGTSDWWRVSESFSI